MCGRFKMLTMDEVTEVIRLIQMHALFNCLPDWPAGPDARPGAIALVIVPGIGELDATELRWGFEASWANRLLFNTRIETALGDSPGLWEDSIRRGRCIVPTMGFFEPHATETRPNPRGGKPVKRQYRFCSPDSGGITLLGGVRDDRAFSIVTTAPNAAIAPVHDRMPLVLREDEVESWLAGDLMTFADRSAIALDVTPEDEGNDPEGQMQLAL